MTSRIRNCLHTRGRYARYCSVVIHFCIVNSFTVNVNYLDNCYIPYQCVSMLQPRILLYLKTNKTNSENT